MTIFWIIAGLLIAGALLFIVPPLLGQGRRPASVTQPEANLSVYRDQLRELDADLAAGTLDKTQYQSARSELESRLLEDAGAAEAAAALPGSRRPLVAVAVAVPVLAISLYLVLGEPKGMDPQYRVAKTAAVGQPHAITPEQIEAMVESLAQRLEAQPNDAEGWTMLARSHAALSRFGDASAAYARAVELLPDNAPLLADYADMLAMARGKSLQGEPEEIIRRALKADPDNIKALMLVGSASFERRDYRGAIRPWQRILELVPPDSQAANSIRASISQAQGLAGQSTSGAQAETPAQKKTAGATVSGTVRLAPAFRARVADNDTVFIFVSAGKGRPPLAILRKAVKDLPLAFTLDDSMAMMPDSRLSSASSVVVGARISKSGDAAPAHGDLQGFSRVVKIGEKGIGVTIDSEVN